MHSLMNSTIVLSYFKDGGLRQSVYDQKANPQMIFQSQVVRMTYYSDAFISFLCLVSAMHTVLCNGTKEVQQSPPWSYDNLKAESDIKSAPIQGCDKLNHSVLCCNRKSEWRNRAFGRVCDQMAMTAVLAIPR